MNTHTTHDYFLKPTEAAHRRYEALRAVFVDGLSLQEVAHHFGVSYGTVRNWVSEFRRQWKAGQPPPFFLPRGEDALRPTVGMKKTQRKPRSPMWRPCRW